MKGRVHSIGIPGLLVMFAIAAAPSWAQGQECTSGLPPDSRSLAPVIDSAGLAAKLAETALLGPDLTIASVTPDSLGAPRVSIWAAELSEDSRAGLKQIVLDHVQGFERTDTVRLVLAENSMVSPRRVSEFAQCKPRLLNNRQVVSDVTDRLSSDDLRMRRTAQVWLFIGLGGQVEETRIRQSSGLLAVDQAAVEGFRSASFTPARVEGIPVSVWIALPITVGQGR